MLRYYWWLLRQLPQTVREQAEFFGFWIPVVGGIAGLGLKGFGVTVPFPSWAFASIVAAAVVYRLLRVNYEEISRQKRMVRALALIHAPGIEDIYAVSKEGKALTFEQIDTDEKFVAWGQKVDGWWKRFENLKPLLTLSERSRTHYMDSADYDGSVPEVTFSPDYLKRWRNVKSTWMTLDKIMDVREADRRAVRSEMMREGFSPELLPPYFAELQAITKSTRKP